jgi:hypothetical protein
VPDQNRTADCSLKSKVKDTSEWLAEHRAHGEPEKVYFVKQPPTYRLFEFVCPCGARHVSMEKE